MLQVGKMMGIDLKIWLLVSNFAASVINFFADESHVGNHFCLLLGRVGIRYL